MSLPLLMQAATNVGCAMNGVNYARWLSAESWVRALFHEYDSQEVSRRSAADRSV